ncbi:hypothetical protein [Streptomyces celluloflavus]|uniref:hypothetical protein n=1 Tax=Streptomyces celluloflavus TaxID=58344 RepID=UPI003647DBDB
MTDAARRTIRTVVQTVLALAAGLPLIIDAAGIPQTAAGVGLALAVAGGLARVMALPGVQALMPGWLRTAPHPDDDLHALDRRRGGER